MVGPADHGQRAETIAVELDRDRTAPEDELTLNVHLQEEEVQNARVDNSLSLHLRDLRRRASNGGHPGAARRTQ